MTLAAGARALVRPELRAAAILAILAAAAVAAILLSGIVPLP